MPAASAIKTYLQLSCVQNIYDIQTPYTRCFLQRITFSFTPEETMLVELVKAYVYWQKIFFYWKIEHSSLWKVIGFTWPEVVKPFLVWINYPVGKNWNHLQKISTDNSLNWDKQKKNGFSSGDHFNLMMQLTQLTLYDLRLKPCAQMLGVL